jgi:hypothetical protein
MKDRRSDTEFGKGFYPADAEKELLTDASVDVTAVQPCYQFPVLGIVLLDIRIQEKKSRTAHSGEPEPDRDTLGASFHIDVTVAAIVVQDAFQRKLINCGLKVALLLPPRWIQSLVEVPLSVEKAHSDERNTEIRCALEIITGQDPQSSGIDRDRLVEPELCGEVSYRLYPQWARGDVVPGLYPFKVLPKPVHSKVDTRFRGDLCRSVFDPLRWNSVEERNWIVTDFPPEPWIDITEKRDHIRLPDPPKVSCELAKFRSHIHCSKSWSLRARHL